MANFYKRQGEVETLSVKTGLSTYRLSEQRRDLYGGRGCRYDELVYLRGQNTDALTVNTKHSDAWTKFCPANGAAGTRSDQIQRDFMQNGTYP